MKSLFTIFTMVVIILFSIFSYGLSAILDILPQLNAWTGDKVGFETLAITSDILQWMPQSIFDYLIPVFLKIWEWILLLSPLLSSMLGYALFFFWISGVLLIFTSAFLLWQVLSRYITNT